jgi:hypothetical protein
MVKRRCFLREGLGAKRFRADGKRASRCKCFKVYLATTLEVNMTRKNPRDEWFIQALLTA